MQPLLRIDEIKRRRKANGLTFQEACNLAGMKGRMTWYGIESGRNINITLDTLQRIAQALGCSARDLIRD